MRKLTLFCFILFVKTLTFAQIEKGTFTLNPNLAIQATELESTVPTFGYDYFLNKNVSLNASFGNYNFEVENIFENNYRAYFKTGLKYYLN